METFRFCRQRLAPIGQPLMRPLWLWQLSLQCCDRSVWMLCQNLVAWSWARRPWPLGCRCLALSKYGQVKPEIFRHEKFTLQLWLLKYWKILDLEILSRNIYTGVFPNFWEYGNQSFHPYLTCSIKLSLNSMKFWDIWKSMAKFKEFPENSWCRQCRVGYSIGIGIVANRPKKPD